MIHWLKRHLASPEYEDKDHNFKARLLNIILLALIILLSFLWIVRLVTGVAQLSSVDSLILGTIILLLVSIFVAARRRYLRLSIYAMLFVTWLTPTALAWNADGVKDSAFMAYMVVILMASLLAGWRAALVMIGFTIAAGWGFVYAESVGLHVSADADTAADFMTDYTFIFGLGGVMIYLLVSNLQNALRDAEKNNQELQALSQHLEVQVSTRTQALETSINISHYITTILDQKELVAEVVQQVLNAFNYYHAQIYLFDEAGEQLIMVGGTGEAGQALLANGHKIARGKGLVGQAALNNQSILVPDTNKATDWLPNPHLPETKAEIAIPIGFGEQVLGVLDVQHNITNGLTEDDSRMLESVAAQMGIALRNARLYAQAQHQAEQESVINEIGRQIRSAANVEMVLEIAARELGQSLGAARTSIEVSRDRIGSNGRTTKENLI